MPASVVRNAEDEADWERAKTVVAHSVGADNLKDHFGLVMHIFQQIKKSKKKG